MVFCVNYHYSKNQINVEYDKIIYKSHEALGSPSRICTCISLKEIVLEMKGKRERERKRGNFFFSDGAH